VAGTDKRTRFILDSFHTQSQLLDLVLSSSATDCNLVALFAPKIRMLLAIVPASSVFMLRGDEHCAHGRDCLDQQAASDLVKVKKGSSAQRLFG